MVLPSHLLLFPIFPKDLFPVGFCLEFRVASSLFLAKMKSRS